MKLLSIYLFICIILLSLLFVSSFVRGKTSYAKVLGFLSLSTQIYILGYLMEINVESLDAMLFWNQVEYFGIPFIPALWLLTCLLYTEHGKAVKGLGLIVVFLVPVTTFVMRLTNSSYHLYYQSISLRNTILGFNALELAKGPFYYLYAVYMIAALIISFVLYYRYYCQFLVEEKSQVSLLTVTSALPLLAIILNIVCTEMSFDFMAVILPVSVLMTFMSLQFYNFLEIRDLGRDFAFEGNLNGLMLLNAQGKVVDFNRKSVDFFNYYDISIKEGDLRTQLDQHPEIYQSIEQKDKSIIKLNIGGGERYFSIVSQRLEDKKIVGRLILIEDITQGEELKKKLIEIANTDELTGLYNRRRFNECAEISFLRAIRDNKAISVLMMDLDFFKKINDNLGHQAGDQVLREMAQTLKKVFRQSDIIGRIGGEEFSVVMDNTDVYQAYEKAEVFRKRLALRKIIYKDVVIPVTVSVGVAELSSGIQKFDDLLMFADNALYKAKEQGRNRTEIAK
ncbi:diguanylate cyclase [Eubacteriaceae bacterium ES3]|nr:diguanylate cyclase [Eubacteriaceae bacterium ES3]